MIAGICIAFMVLILIITVSADVNKEGSTFIGLLLGVAFACLLMITMEDISPSMRPIDVYRGNTTLEITYRDSIPVDTVVVWKEDIK